MLNIMNENELRSDGLRKEIIDAIKYAFSENDPAYKVKSFLDRINDLKNYNRIFVIGFGKASYEMYLGAQSALQNRIAYGGIIVPDDSPVVKEKINAEIFYGTHPILSDKSIESTRTLISRLPKLEKDDLVIVLISGGGSSLFEMLRPGISLPKYQQIIKCMMDNGANIYELNAIRSIFSLVKGGKLRDFLCPARVLSLIISDVPGDDVNFIASGPLSDPPDRDLIDRTIKKFRTKCSLDIDQPIYQESKKCQVENNIIIKNLNFVSSIYEYFSRRNYQVLNLGSGITGSVSSVSRNIHEVLKGYYALIKKPYFFVGGGETTVNVKGSGIGGRNLELCLRYILNTKRNEKYIFSSIGTDGIDGPSNAMGGIVDNLTENKISRNKIKRYLRNSESLTPLKISGDVIVTGRTGNNVSDVFIGYIENI